MIKGIFPTEKFKAFETPFYYYDMALLRDTLDTIRRENDSERIDALLGLRCVEAAEVA